VARDLKTQDGGVDWTYLAQDKGKWQAAVNTDCTTSSWLHTSEGTRSGRGVMSQVCGEPAANHETASVLERI
jgi:hypothetical protein